jgi:hypothetical protein
MKKSTLFLFLQYMAITLLLMFFYGVMSIHAQNGKLQANGISSYAGRYFLIGFMQNELIVLPGGIRLTVHISTIRPTTVRIAGPITGPSQYLQLAGDTVVELRFPADKLEMFESEKIQSRSIEIESDQPISVSGISSQSLSTDGYSAIPVSKWGREYVIHSWPNDIYMHDDEPQGKIPRSSEFMIIASEDNTVIEFAPRSRTSGQIQPGESTIISLNKGQCYLVKSDTLPSGEGDLSGTIVRGDKPIGVFSGHLRTAIPLGLTEFDSKNHLIEMLYPTEQWGSSFITVPFTNDGTGDFFRIHCIAPNTKVTVKGWNINQTFTLSNPGDFRTLSFIRDPLHIESDKPISIAQYMTSSFSSNDRLQNFDPCMMLIPSTEKSIKSANFHVIANPATNPKQFAQHFISLVCTEDAVDHVMLDNRLIRNAISNFPNQRVNGTQMFYVTVPVTPGFHRLTTMEGAFIAGLYGIGSDDAYAYPLAFGMVQGVDTTAPKISLKDSCGIIKGKITEVIIDDFSGLYDVNVIRDSTQNMNWSLAGFKEGDTTTTFSGNVINKLKDAFMVIEVMDNAGNSSRLRYVYTAPKITIPDSLSFDKMIMGDTQCRKIVLHNTGKESILIQFAKLIGDARMIGSNLSALTNAMIPPNDSIQIEICFRAIAGTDSANATLQILFDCGIYKPIKISGVMENPAIQVIGHDFGTVAIGDIKPGIIRIINAGGTDFTATSLQVPISSGAFNFDTAGVFPKIFKPRDTATIKCTFSPLERKAYSEFFTILNDRSLTNQAEVKGNGASPGLSEFIIDWKERRLGARYDTVASITNTGNDLATISLDNVSPLDSVFRISFPNQKKDTVLQSNQTIALLASFFPKDSIKYLYQGKITYTNGFSYDSSSYTLIGNGIIPGITQRDIYVGRVKENSIKDTSGILLTANGNAPLTINGFTIISGDISSFTLDTIDFINKAFNPRESYVLPIRFKPQRAGRHEILVETQSDAGLIGQTISTRSIIWGDADATDTIDVRMSIQPIDTLYACEERLITARISNDGNIDITVDSIIARLNQSLQGSSISINAVSDSIIKKRGGSITISLLLDSKSSGNDEILLTVYVADTIELKQIIPFSVKTNHISIDSSIKSTITYLPGDSFELLINGDFAVASKTDIGFEPILELEYNPQSIDCKTTQTQFDLSTNSGDIRLPIQVINGLGRALMNAQTQTFLKGQGTWNTKLTFDTYLTDRPDSIRIILKNRISDCIIGDTAIIPLELSEFCGKHIRVVSNDLKGQGLLGIYPHPIPESGYIALLSKQDEWYSYEVKNLFGETVLQKNGNVIAGFNKIALDASILTGGSYILIFQTVNHQWTKQIIISK